MWKTWVGKSWTRKQVSNVWHTSTSTLTNCCWVKVTIWGNWATQLVLRRNHILWRYSRVLRLHPCSCYFIIVLNYFLHLFLDSLNKWGLLNQPSQSRRQPKRDLTKLEFADNLTLVAGLEEVSRTCCPHVNFIRCFYSSLGRETLMKRLTLTTPKIWGTSLIVAE